MVQHFGNKLFKGVNTMHRTINRTNFGDNIYLFLCYFFIIFLCAITIFPLLYVISASLSDATDVMRGDVFLIPQNITFRAYEVVMNFKGIWISYFNTIYYVVVGTIINIFMTALAAYPLSRKKWRARKFFSFFIVFTMWFGGGIVPFFLLIKNLGLMDTRLAILIYPAISAFYVIIMRTYFEGIPSELEESAKIDGANELIILVRIIIPVSLPVIASIGLFYAVARWNSFFWEMIILSSADKMPIQVILQRIIFAGQLGQEMEKGLTRGEATIPITIKYACIVITALPIIMIYPFLQKYFVKGVLIGSVKG